jgi:hypothetical protein
LVLVVWVVRPLYISRVLEWAHLDWRMETLSKARIFIAKFFIGMQMWESSK